MAKPVSLAAHHAMVTTQKGATGKESGKGAERAA